MLRELKAPGKPPTTHGSSGRLCAQHVGTSIRNADLTGKIEVSDGPNGVLSTRLNSFSRAHRESDRKLGSRLVQSVLTDVLWATFGFCLLLQLLVCLGKIGCVLTGKWKKKTKLIDGPINYNAILQLDLF